MSQDLVPSVTPSFHLSTHLQSWLGEVSSTKNGVLSSAGKIDAIGSAEELWAIFDKGYESQLKGRVVSGLVLLRIRDLSSRDFAQGLKDRGFTAGTAYRLMKAAKVYLALPNLEAVHRASEFDFVALTELVQLVGEDGFALLAQGKSVSGLTFDEARALSTREIEALRKAATEKDDTLRKLRKQLDNETVLRKEAEGLAELARGQAPDLPAWARVLRSEAACASEATLAALDIAHEAFFKALEAPIEGGMNKAERARQLQAAGSVLYASIAAAAAKASVFLEEIKDHLGKEIAQAAAPVFTTVEIRDLEKRRRAILETARADYEEREIERANGERDGFKKGRGRPRKVTTKAPRKSKR